MVLKSKTFSACAEEKNRRKNAGDNVFKSNC